MKKITFALLVLTTILSISSCAYEETYGDYTYTTCYFAYDQMDRSVIIDEFDYIQVGCVLGGKISNDDAEWFQYELVDSLVTNAGYEVLPASMYDITNNDYLGQANTVEIPVGNMLGMMKVTLQPSFFADSLALEGKYALAFRVIDHSTDSVGKTESIVTFKYLSSAIGTYTHSGVAVAGDSSLSYENDDIELTTTTPVGENVVISDKISVGSNDLVFKLTIDADNNVSVKEGSGSDFQLTNVSTGFFDKDGDNSIYLNYSYDDNGLVFEATDTLTFKKRVVDNVLQVDARYF